MQRGGQGIYGSVDIVWEYISKNVHISASTSAKRGAGYIWECDLRQNIHMAAPRWSPSRACLPPKEHLAHVFIYFSDITFFFFSVLFIYCIHNHYGITLWQCCIHMLSTSFWFPVCYQAVYLLACLPKSLMYMVKILNCGKHFCTCRPTSQTDWKIEQLWKKKFWAQIA